MKGRARVPGAAFLILAGALALVPRAEAWHGRSHVFLGFHLHVPLSPSFGYSYGYPYYGYRHYYYYPHSYYAYPPYTVYAPPPVVVYQPPATYAYAPPPTVPAPSGRLQVEVWPDGVQVFVDGRFVGTAGALRGGAHITVAPGHHVLEFRLNGFTSATEVDVSPGSTTVVQRHLS